MNYELCQLILIGRRHRSCT